LIVLMLLAPLMGVFLRKAPWLGLALVALVFLNNFEGLLILRGLMPVMFYIGGMAALRSWNLQAMDRFAWPCLLVFVLFCVAVLYWRVTNITYLGLVAPFLIWPAAVLLQDTVVGHWLQQQSKYSFFIFVAHAPILLATWMAFQKLGGNIPYVVYWIGAPMVVIGVLSMVYRIASWLAPSVFAFVTGGRVAHSDDKQKRPSKAELAGGNIPR
jgi:succinoglycan biosynthesis protein ExoH